MPQSNIRSAAVAGQFYAGDRTALEQQVMACFEDTPRVPSRHRAAIVPHAGLMYSGACAARVYSRLAFPKTVVIVAPNHTGACTAPGGVSVAPHDGFETPLGTILVDHEFAERVLEHTDLAAADAEAHRREHAIEVELPFLFMLDPSIRIVPIVLAWDDWARCQVLADALVSVVASGSVDVLFLASSDMSHYEPASRALAKDQLALSAIERLDGAELLEACRRDRITMCGRAPAAVVIEAARQLGAESAEVVDYRHSGWVTGDDQSVVTYAGICIE